MEMKSVIGLGNDPTPADRAGGLASWHQQMPGQLD